MIEKCAAGGRMVFHAAIIGNTTCATGRKNIVTCFILFALNDCLCHRLNYQRIGRIVKDIINTGSSNVVNGKGIIFDFNYVNREQTFLTEVLNKNPLSESDARAINSTFKNFEFMHAEYSLAKTLLGSSSIDYKNQTHREAIGRSLVFIEHFLSTNDYQKASQTKEFQSAVDYLKKEYGEKNTKNFLNAYKEKLGQ